MQDDIGLKLFSESGLYLSVRDSDLEKYDKMQRILSAYILGLRVQVRHRMGGDTWVFLDDIPIEFDCAFRVVK